MNKLKIVSIIALLVLAWGALRTEMCSPLRPYGDGITGSVYVLRYSDGYHPGPIELLQFQGPIVDLCVGDDEVYGSDPICVLMVSLFKIGGPGRLWACPCSVGAEWLNGHSARWQFSINQITCGG